jgi:hypothetical protein
VIDTQKGESKMKSKLIFTAALLCVTLCVPLPVFSQSQDFEMNGTVLVRYRGSAANVTIPAGVTAIGYKAFYECEGISVIMSRRTRLGYRVFDESTYITYSD